MATHKTPVVTDLKEQTLVTLRTLKTSTDKNPGSLKNYEKIGGYKQLKRIVKDKVKATMPDQGEARGNSGGGS